LGIKRKEIIGGWWQLHNEFHNSLKKKCFYDDKSSRMKWVGHVARLEEIINGYKMLIEERGGIPVGRSRCIYEDNIKAYVIDVGFECVDCIRPVPSKYC
jgi:hypothetical protein